MEFHSVKNRAILVLVATLCGTGLTRAQTLTYNGSAQYARGNYFFTEQTGSFYLNNGMSITGSGITLSINIPYIVQSSPWVSYSSHGLMPTGGPNNGSVSSKGDGQKSRGRRIDPGQADTISYSEGSFGDPNMSGSFRLLNSGNGRTTVNSNFNIKFPIADPTSGYGTGSWDFGAGISIAQRFGSRFVWLLDTMYWQLGDMDELEFKNPVSYSTGIGGFFANTKWMITASFYGYTRILEDTDPPLSAGIGSGLSLSPTVQLTSNITVGLTESVPDFSTGLGWSIKL